MILGVTGTRYPEKLTVAQRKFLRKHVEKCDELHTGAATGADEFAFDVAVALPHIKIVVHPPVDERFMMPKEKWLMRDNIEVREAKPFLDRDRDCVDESEKMIACPDGYIRRPRSGTWYTIGYAEQQKKPLTKCYPDGTIE